MHRINAKLTSCSYDVNIKDNLSDAFVQTLEKSNYDKIFILTNELIQSLHSKHEIFNQGYKIIPVNNNERSIIPPNAKFFMGGSGIPYGEMLRGYQDNTIGPFGISRPRGGNIIIKYSKKICRYSLCHERWRNCRGRQG